MIRAFYFFLAVNLLSCNHGRNEKLVLDHAIGLVDFVDLKEFDSVRLYNDDGTVWKAIVLNGNNFENFSPWILDPDDIHLTFKCKSIGAGYYEVFVNEAETKRLPIESGVCVYYDWDKFILSGKYSIDLYGQPIFKESGDSQTAIRNNGDLFTPIKIDKEWLQIRWKNNESGEEMEGWVKWRTNDSVTVRLLN